MLVEDYIKSLRRYEFVDSFMDYTEGYICDIISEISSNDVSIFTADLVSFVSENDYWVDEALSCCCIEAYGPIRDSGELQDFIARIGAMAWFLKAEHDIYENLEECVLAAVVTYIAKVYQLESLTTEQIEELEYMSFDSNDRLDVIIEEAEQLLGLVDDEEDED